MIPIISFQQNTYLPFYPEFRKHIITQAFGDSCSVKELHEAPARPGSGTSMASSHLISDVAQNIIFFTTPVTPPDLCAKLKEAMKVIASKPVGRRLLSKIAGKNYEIYISYKANETWCCPHDKVKSRAPKVGCGASIVVSEDTKQVLDAKMKPIDMPFFISLAHELIHAYHFSYGKNRTDHSTYDKALWSNDEEYHTIAGLRSDAVPRLRPRINENSIRTEHGLPLRFTHKGAK